MPETYLHALEEVGFVVRRQIVGDPVLRELQEAVERHQSSLGGRSRRGELFGMRNLLAAVPEVREFACSAAMQALVLPVLGDDAAAVRGLYFDKTPAANWRLGWHQDKAIAVKERRDVPGYGRWSIKAGVQHVFPPSEVLAGMLTVRVHLDACDETSGALKVISGTHRSVLEEADFRRLSAEVGVTTCSVDRGDALVMRPLLAHASDKASVPVHRRVIHLEYAARPLPPPLAWNEHFPLGHPP